MGIPASFKFYFERRNTYPIIHYALYLWWTLKKITVDLLPLVYCVFLPHWLGAKIAKQGQQEPVTSTHVVLKAYLAE